MFYFNSYHELLNQELKKIREQYKTIFLNYIDLNQKTFKAIVNSPLPGDSPLAKKAYDDYVVATEDLIKSLLNLNIDIVSSTPARIKKFADIYADNQEKMKETFPDLKQISTLFNLKFSPFAYAAGIASLMGTPMPTKAEESFIEHNEGSEIYNSKIRSYSHTTVINPGDLIKKTNRLTRPEKIHFKERVDLKSALNAKGNTLRILEKERDILKDQISEQEDIVKQTLSNVRFDERYQDLVNDPSCFMNRVTSEEAKLYGNLSALVYQVDLEKKIAKADSKVTKIDRQIALLNQQITLLESWQDHLINSLKSSKDTEQVMNDVRKNIRQVFNVDFEKDTTIKEITHFFINKIDDFQQNLDTLMTQQHQENSAYFAEAKKIFGHNLFGSNYEIQAVFHRNNGEFSGVAAYDKEKNKLVLSFAGSKSSTDWLKNAFGWNNKLSSKHGLLTNISFHSGFGSHLDDNADSFFSFMHSWMRRYQANQGDRKLEVVGTGHSLGGSIAAIFTAATKQFADKYNIKATVGVMTFGSPNLVNSNSLEAFTDILGGAGNVIRFAHSYDPTPKVVFWKMTPGTTTIEGDTSLLYDVNGTLVLPIRVNPHSSEEYYHAAETVFKAWKNNFSKLQRQVSFLDTLKDKEKEKTSAIREVSKEAHSLLAKLANQDENSADVFEDEFLEYQKKIETELSSLKDQLTSLIDQAKSQEGAAISKKEKAQFNKQALLLRNQIETKKQFLKELSQDKAWKPYVSLIDKEFEALQKDLSDLTSPPASA